MSNFSNMSLDTLRHARQYGWIYLKDEELYQFIQELFPRFSIERLDELHTKLENGLEALSSDARTLFNELEDASQFEIYKDEIDVSVTIICPDDIDPPYPYLSMKGGVYEYLNIVDIDDMIALLEIDNILKFRPTNRNTFTYMEEEGVKYLPFNKELYMSKYSKIISLDKIYNYAMEIKRHKNTGIKRVEYVMDGNSIYVDGKRMIVSSRKEYEDVCMSMSQIL